MKATTTEYRWLSIITAFFLLLRSTSWGIPLDPILQDQGNLTETQSLSNSNGSLSSPYLQWDYPPFTINLLEESENKIEFTQISSRQGFRQQGNNLAAMFSSLGALLDHDREDKFNTQLVYSPGVQDQRGFTFELDTQATLNRTEVRNVIKTVQTYTGVRKFRTFKAELNPQLPSPWGSMEVQYTVPEGALQPPLGHYDRVFISRGDAGRLLEVKESTPFQYPSLIHSFETWFAQALKSFPAVSSQKAFDGFEYSAPMAGQSMPSSISIRKAGADGNCPSKLSLQEEDTYRALILVWNFVRAYGFSEVSVGVLKLDFGDQFYSCGTIDFKLSIPDRLASNATAASVIATS